jgi:hypothetical protein
MTIALWKLLLRRKLQWEVESLIALGGHNEDRESLIHLAVMLERTHPDELPKEIWDPEIIWKLVHSSDPFIRAAALSYHVNAKSLLRRHWE